MPEDIFGDPPPPKFEAKEFPEPWFDAIYEANAHYPQSSGGIGLKFLNALMNSGWTGQEIMAIERTKWSFTSDQADVMAKGLRGMHVTYGVPWTDTDQTEEHKKALAKRHEGYEPEIKEIDSERMDRYAETSTKIVNEVFTRMREALGRVISNPKEVFPIVRTYTKHAAETISGDEEFLARSQEYKDIHRAFYLSFKPGEFTHEEIRKKLKEDPKIQEARAILATTLIKKAGEAIAIDPVLAQYEVEKRAQIISRLTTAVMPFL